jgi:hypothetical protein
MRGYGVDEARSSFLPWCKCGWRQLASTYTESRQVLADHRNSVHGDAASEILKSRSKVSRA